MNNGSFQNEDVMEDYLSALLTDDEPVVETVQRDSVERLLQNVDAPVKTEQVETKNEVAAPVSDEVLQTQEVALPSAISERLSESLAHVDLPEEVGISEDNLKALKEGEFQALFFEVAGLTLAVPLTHLGGIHNLEKPNPLFGKPDWFLGVMLYREEKLSVVDTAQWVMPEKCNETLADSLHYQYLIMLGESAWGLTCERLINTVTLKPEDVRWRTERSKRPWLAGMVKEKMCALLDISQLIDMLDKGLASNEQ
ncbi:chemotaxis protein CheW [Alteromonas sp. a30]|uniref:chemotaxis protein CheW n=1 Tax=Alteromonas sp. a30 TaxID=2730917 RepID=UPI0022806044|nr:chemotaxis protein CheW [Alteromonas sp. a30]MCY7294410.1 chemotaxis protein CheW [Alteromonas sp. a30]